MTHYKSLRKNKMTDIKQKRVILIIYPLLEVTNGKKTTPQKMSSADGQTFFVTTSH
jgi:hypothetical protein